jgi:hypothetical protein
MEKYLVTCRKCRQRWVEHAENPEELKKNLQGHRSCFKGQHPLSTNLFEAVDIAVVPKKKG